MRNGCETAAKRLRNLAKLCEVDGVKAAKPCETLRNSRETPAKLPRNLAKLLRNGCETVRNACETLVILRHNPVRGRGLSLFSDRADGADCVGRLPITQRGLQPTLYSSAHTHGSACSSTLWVAPALLNVAACMWRLRGVGRTVAGRAGDTCCTASASRRVPGL